MRTQVKRLTQKVFSHFGFEVRRKERFRRSSLLGALNQVRELGWQPKTCIDVGAAFGDFTLECSKIFPHSRYLLIEPLEEYQSFLNAVVAQIPNADYVTVAVTSAEGMVTIHVHKDWVGSSIYRETEGPHVNGVERIVPATTLDKLCYKHNLAAPYLLKLDVQGAELDVLRGASEVLRNTEYMILEVSLFQFFIGGPQLYDVVTFMKEKGFVAYDIFHLQYRPIDRALSQVDMAFVKEDGIFRRQHIYASRQQRDDQDTRFLEMIARRRIELQRGGR